MKKIKSIGLVLITTLIVNIVFAQKMMSEKTVLIGGAHMNPAKNIMQNAENSKDHTTLIAAVKASGLGDFLKTPGPFTLFAPTNEAFNKLPKGTLESLLKPENKSKLSSVVYYHIVSGKFGTKELDEWMKRGNGTAEISTISGHKLWVIKKSGKYWLKDEKGGMAQITINNAFQKNGVIHVIDHVVLSRQ